MRDLILLLTQIDPKLPHGSNLKTKALKELKSQSKHEALTKEIVMLYLAFNNSLQSIDDVHEKSSWITDSLAYLEVYYNHIKSDKFRIYSHQSDFLSSLLPEFLYRMYKKFILNKYPDFSIETQKDLIIDLSFLPYNGSSVNFKSKRVDVAILKPCSFVVNNTALSGFNIPIIAVEVKTNLDKNMISGVEYSVQRLKRTFPLCKYYLISEFVDFAYEKQNYASSAIDEILIKRKQKRSEVRHGAKTLNPIDSQLMLNHLEEVLFYIEVTSKEPLLLSKRLKMGKLIKPE